MKHLNWSSAIQHCQQAGRGYVIATIINTQGSTPRDGGSKMVVDASESVLRELYALNIEYEQRYGFIFIVCATGKSAEDMLGLLKARIDNGRVIELMNGAHEQAAITRLRLEQLLQ